MNKSNKYSTKNPHAKSISFEEYNEKVANLKTLGDVNNFVKDLVAPTLQAMLDAEMNNHLGYPKKDPSGNLSGNSRNGHYPKKIKTASAGNVDIRVPRDRNGEFEPIVVRKYENIESDIEERIISMYAKGMTTGDINIHMNEIYGVNIDKSTVSTITDKILPLVKEWQNRPLSSIYPIVYLDAIHFKVRDNGKIVSKAAYIALGINMEGMKEILGIWIGENEGAKFWLSILNEIKHRGVEDILITCIDGLKGFPEAIKGVFPETQIQKCIIHQIRNTVKYISHKEKKRFCNDLKNIYTAVTEKTGYEELQKMKKQWNQYAIYLKSWEDNWDELSTFFNYSEEIRRIIYTTNTIESLNRQFRKVTKTTTIFPNDESLEKLLYLAQNDVTKKWNKSIRHWGKIITQLAIIFPERIKLS